MKVSVIIPVYNVEDYLTGCISSVLGQTFAHLEVILVDDGSTDQSGNICDNFEHLDPRVIVVHKQNGGLSSARNAGLSIATGDYIIFLDSDDYWSSNTCLDELVRVASQMNTDIVRGMYHAVDESGDTLYYGKKRLAKYEQKILSSGDFWNHVLLGEFFVVLFLFKKSCISDISFDENRTFQEDIDFNIKLFTKELRCTFTNISFYAYRQRSGSITTSPKLTNIIGSLSLINTFYHYSSFTSSVDINKAYLSMCALMYYWTLKTLATPAYSLDLSSSLAHINIEHYQRQAIEWGNYRQLSFIGLIIHLNPQHAINILRHLIILEQFAHKVFDILKKHLPHYEI